MITSLLRFNLVSEQPEALVAFYRDILGIPVLTEDADFNGVCFGFVEQPHFTVWRAHENNPKCSGNSQLIFMCENVEESYKELLAKGVVCNPPYETYWGGAVLDLADPDGNFVRLRT